MNNLEKNTLLGRLLTLATVCLLLLASACSMNDEPAPLSPEQAAALEKRVTERWKFMEEKDFSNVYTYASPNYRRIFPKSMYLNKFSYSVDWELTGVDILNYDARAAVASVAVRVMSKPTKQTSSASIAMGALPVTLHESWIHVEGEWWHSTKVK
ncbi:MAG: hypothetical protein IMF06_15830 [Proteobacteria bacterium]|nr:hypothetical protein [Pseudomonadota bacterium]